MAATAAPVPRVPDRQRPLGVRIRGAILPIYTALVVGYLFLPILVMAVFGFNDIEGRFNFTWQGFTLEHWANLFNRYPALNQSLINSLIVAVVSTLAATTFGTLIGLALTRYEFRGRGPLNLLIFLPIATPEIVLGASLLAMFVTAGVSRDLTTITIAHIMFNVSFVVVTVRARLAGFDRALEEAAMDLGADEWTTFRKVTFPLIFPGILAAGMLAFALSIDDFVITQFTSGTEQTFPIWVWASIRNNLPPQIHVIGTMVFLGAVALVAISTVYERYAERRDRRIAHDESARAAAAHLEAPA